MKHSWYRVYILVGLVGTIGGLFCIFNSRSAGNYFSFLVGLSFLLRGKFIHSGSLSANESGIIMKEPFSPPVTLPWDEVDYALISGSLLKIFRKGSLAYMQTPQSIHLTRARQQPDFVEIVRRHTIMPSVGAVAARISPEELEPRLKNGRYWNASPISLKNRTHIQLQELEWDQITGLSLRDDLIVGTRLFVHYSDKKNKLKRLEFAFNSNQDAINFTKTFLKYAPRDSMFDFSILPHLKIPYGSSQPQ